MRSRTRSAIRIVAAAWGAIALAASGLLLGVARAQPQPSAVGSPGASASAGVDEIASRLFRDAKLVGLVVGIVDHGQERVLSFGEVTKGSGRAPDAHTIFDLGTATTTFTATVLAALAERGVVHLDDPLQKYVPRRVVVPSAPGRPITLLDLSTHTSGLPSLRELRQLRRPRLRQGAGLYGLLSDAQLIKPPGEQFSVSGFDYVLLANALAKASDRSFDALLESEVSTKLGLGDTGTQIAAAQEPRYAQGYTADGLATPHLRPLPIFVGSVDLHSTLADMLKFLRWNVGLTDTSRALLPILQQRRRETAQPGVGIGLAWRIRAMEGGGKEMLFCNGVAPGFHAAIAFVRETQTGVVLLANTATGAIEHAGLNMLRAMNGVAPATPLPGATPSARDDDIDEP